MSKTKKREAKIKFVGKTTDGKLVVDGRYVYKEIDSGMLGMSDLMIKFNELNWVVDWIGFYEASQKSNWTYKTVIRKIREGLLDSCSGYTNEYCDEIIKRLNFYINNMRNKS